jgi:hypothetical protein
MLTVLVAAVVTAAPAAASAAVPPSTTAAATTAAAAAFSVAASTVTPVLADYPYTPVLRGGDRDLDLDDPRDCSVTGYETRAADGQGVYAATGCGGARLQLTVAKSPDAAPGYVQTTATTTARYGCVNEATRRTRVVLTRTAHVVGQVSVFETPYAESSSTVLGSYTVLPLETVPCKARERAAQLGVTVSGLTVSVYPTPDTTLAPSEVHTVAGTWTATLPVAAAAVRASSGR